MNYTAFSMRVLFWINVKEYSEVDIMIWIQVGYPLSVSINNFCSSLVQLRVMHWIFLWPQGNMMETSIASCCFNWWNYKKTHTPGFLSTPQACDTDLCPRDQTRFSRTPHWSCLKDHCWALIRARKQLANTDANWRYFGLVIITRIIEIPCLCTPITVSVVRHHTRQSRHPICIFDTSLYPRIIVHLNHYSRLVKLCSRR